jgi:hypothetical protein
MKPEIIYCADGNARFAKIAIEAGFTYGAQLPNTVYFQPDFTDQNWNSPDLERYVEAVAQYRPRLATILDWQRWSQLGTVMQWAWAIAPYVQEAIIVIPKVRFLRNGWQDYIPRAIRGIEVRFGYSIPTRFGGTTVKLTGFLERPIHLLGGSPIVQGQLAGLHLNGCCQLFESPRLEVASVDGNYHQLMATKYNRFFVPGGSARYGRNRFWPTLKEADGKKWGDGSAKADAPYEAFRRSCENIMAMWGKKETDHVKSGLV